MKRIKIDTNFNWFGPNFPSLSQKEVNDNNIHINEKIIAFQDDDEWIGTV